MGKVSKLLISVTLPCHYLTHGSFLTPHRIQKADKARILNNDQYIDQVEEKKPKVQENYVPTHWIAEHADKRQV